MATQFAPFETYEQALMSAHPVEALRDVVSTMLDDGHPREDVLRDLETLALDLRADNREVEEDAVTDVADFVAGWCSPHMVL